MLRVGAAWVPHAGKCCKVILRNVTLGTWKRMLPLNNCFVVSKV